MDQRRLWDDDETRFLFWVHLTESSSDLQSGSFRIHEVARLLNRTPGSIHRKLEDIRSNNPSYIASGRKPTNCAVRVRELWSELNDNLEASMGRMRDSYLAVCGQVVESSELYLDSYIPRGYDVPMEATRRQGQQLFRLLVATGFDRRCCITGMATLPLLVASHIKPWSESTPEERIDPSNGLLLNRLHDGLFDRHLMTLDEDMRILYAESVRQDNTDDIFEDFFGRYEGRKVSFPVEHTKVESYMSHHRMVFERMVKMS